MVIQLHKDQRDQVRSNSVLFGSFPIVNSVKRGYVLAPTLFSIFFCMMLKQVIEDLDDGSLFNLSRQHAHTKTLDKLFRDLFADDAALVAHTQRALQHLTSCFAEAVQLFGPVVSLKKTEALHLTASIEVYHPLHITIGGTDPKAVRQFTYLGCTITSVATVYEEVDNRLAKANGVFSGLYKRGWNNKHLKKSTKISVYRAVVLTTLLYGSESWVTYCHHLRLLERFHHHCLRTIFNIHWSSYVSSVEVLDQAEITSIEAMLLKSQLQWAAHISKMGGGHRLLKIALYSELSTGYRDRGASNKRFKDSLKKTLGTCHIDHHQWSTLAAERQAWRLTIHQVVSNFEDSR